MKKVLALIAFGFFLCVSYGQDKPLYEIHSQMMFNFIKYIQWPNEAEPGDFVVGVMGDDDVYNTLKGWYDGKPKGAKKYVVKKLATAAEAADCSVVYLGTRKNKEFENIKNASAGKAVLTITDSSNLGQKGSCINFRVIDGKLKFELNQAAVAGSNLKVSSALSSMAIVI
jgi:hypothetical protein